MPEHIVNKGLTLRMAGEPEQSLEIAKPARYVGIQSADGIGLRPRMHVSVGDSVARGQLLFEDKTTPDVRYTAPSAGTVVSVHRGDRRAFESVVIEQSRAETEAREPESQRFSSFSGRHPSGLSESDVRALLLESGQWTSLRARPFDRIANPATSPDSIFVTAIDSNPLAPSIDSILEGRKLLFDLGVSALSRLTTGPVFVCTASNPNFSVSTTEQVRHETFTGPHPVGTVGLHIHALDPVDRQKVVWHIGIQDVIATGNLFRTGLLDSTRVVSLAGPPVVRPRLLRTRVGASTDELVTEEVDDQLDIRIISGSVFSGRKATGQVHGYLGRYHQQVSVLEEGRDREFLGWLTPGLKKFSTVRSFLSSLLPKRELALTTSTHGSHRAIIPIGNYERVMPLDLMATSLLRALVMADVERAEELGCLELAEEDVALCTFVDVGKTEFGSHLRNVLEILEKEG